MNSRKNVRYRRLSRSEFDTTDTELSAIAPAAMTGFKSIPKAG